MVYLTDYDLERLIEKAPSTVLAADGQLTVYDRLLYFWSAKEFYKGEGTIIDAGALVGGSTIAFAEGLLQNPHGDFKNPIIHVYDLFEDDSDGYSAQLLKGWYNEAEDKTHPYDFEKHFRRNTQSYSDLMRIYKGDITKFTYDNDRGIEILSLDVAKSADLMLFCANEFFPKLIPERSIILHQDYIFPYQPWLHIAMELLADVVEKIYDVPNHCTSVFTLKRAISKQDIEARLGRTGDDFYHLGNAKFLYRSIEKARPGYGRFVHTAALAYFYARMGQRKSAVQVAMRMLEELDPTTASIDTAALGPFLQDELCIDYKARGR